MITDEKSDEYDKLIENETHKADHERLFKIESFDNVNDYCIGCAEAEIYEDSRGQQNLLNSIVFI